MDKSNRREELLQRFYTEVSAQLPAAAINFLCQYGS
jgi:hypothetical protein